MELIFLCFGGYFLVDALAETDGAVDRKPSGRGFKSW